MIQYKPQVYLHIPPAMWDKFRSTMLGVRQGEEEVIGFFFCQRQQLTDRVRYVPVAWVVPSPECYKYQSTDGLILKQSFHRYLLDTYLQKQSEPSEINNSDRDNFDRADFWCDEDLEDSFFSNTVPLNTALDVVHIHTHFGFETPHFSDIDDRHEAQYARFLAANYGSRLISGVFNESIDEYQFRIWNREGTYQDAIAFYHSWFALDRLADNEMVDYQNDSLAAESMFARQQIFGRSVQNQLSQLKVALVGCGGIGSVFVQQLGRLGVKNWILIDGDRLETSNLNRMPGVTHQIIKQNWYKVDYLKYLIAQIYPDNLETIAIPAFIETNQTEIADADLIVVATDNHRSRLITQELALKYVRPLICLGTHIELKDRTPRMYCRVTVPPFGDEWCLMCGNIINLQQVALETAPQAIANVTERAGYLRGVKDPAVFWLNSICASTGVGIVHGLLSGFIDLDFGLDWIYDFPNSNWLKTNTQHLATPDCYFCSGDRV